MFKSKITPILAATALVVAVLGSTPLGEAAANVVLPKRSVGTAQLKTNAVVGTKIAKNAVTGEKVRNGTLLAADNRRGTGLQKNIDSIAGWLWGYVICARVA